MSIPINYHTSFNHSQIGTNNDHKNQSIFKQQSQLKGQDTSNNQQRINTQTEQTSEGHKILTFIGCVCIIYLCQIINGVIQQRIYKIPYKSTTTSANEFYTDPLSPMVITSFFAATIGYMKLQQHELQLQIPIKKLLKLAFLQVVIHFGLMWALMNASYILVIMANSCGLLSVIVVGVYYSSRNNRSYQPNDQTNNDSQQRRNNQNNRQTLGPQKILICLMVCIGIFIFNYFTQSHKNSTSKITDSTSKITDSTSQSASLLIFVVLGIVIILEGFRPQLQKQIKQQYEPSPICFYYNYNKVSFIVVLIISLVSLQLPYTIKFIFHHDQLLLHLMIMSLLSAISTVFVYKIITLFRQHIYPLVSTVRKCITVGVSILYFGHQISIAQLIGILLVFGGVLLQISTNYKLLQKWDINIPFSKQQQMERYVKNKQYKQMDNNGIKKKYQVYKIVHKDGDVQGI